MRLLLLAVAALSGCATSSGIVPTGPDTFTLSKSEKGFSITGQRVKSDTILEAGQYCQVFGKVLEVIRAEGQDMRPFRSDARAEVEFKCVPAK